MPVAAEIGFESGHDDHVADTGLDPQVASGAHVGLVRLVRLDRVDRFVVEDHPKNPHATTARVSSTKTTTSAMSVADRFWFRNGLNPMSDNVAHFLASLARSVGEAQASRRMAGWPDGRSGAEGRIGSSDRVDEASLGALSADEHQLVRVSPTCCTDRGDDGDVFGDMVDTCGGGGGLGVWIVKMRSTTPARPSRC